MTNVAQVILENVYKSVPARKGDTVVAPVTTEPKVTNDEESPSLEAEKSGQTPKTVNILRRINLEVNDGEFMVLVGPSGCGKSTLLRIIAGLEELTAGKIWVGNRQVNDLPPKERDIAMVFQNYALYPHLSVYENIAFGLRRTGYGQFNMAEDSNGNSKSVHWGKNLPPQIRQGLVATGMLNGEVRSNLENVLTTMTRSLPRELRYLSEREKKIDQQVRKVAKLLQVEHLLNRLPKQLSGGQKQRIALGRAISRNPQVFLMDEPLSNLDAKLRAETRSQIVKLQRQLGTTTIYVTHDQTEAMTMGDRIAVMKDGRIQQIAAPLEIYNQPANRFVAEFIGSPPMNFIPVQVKAPRVVCNSQFRLTLPEVWEPILHQYDGQSLTLGVRPEHMSISAPAPKNLVVSVDLVEALGNDTYLSVSIPEDSSPLQVRVPPDKIVRIGDEIWLSIDPEKIHLFNPHDGMAITKSDS
ncbi:MAG: ATP-binding cassette domain-containing protein [Moorea sp. SIO3G5]|nr:ATP-binding cassette domain-containing protein [Moorena sp. SIO3G5]